MKGKLMLVGSIGAGVLLVLALFPSVVGYQTVQTTLVSKLEQSLVKKIDNVKTTKSILTTKGRILIVQQIKEKMKNNDWKPGSILNIKSITDAMKDDDWFPGLFLIIVFIILIAGIGISYITFQLFSIVMFSIVHHLNPFWFLVSLLVNLIFYIVNSTFAY